jgi:hypothetical protein
MVLAGQSSFAATPGPAVSNPEMTAIYEADQADRAAGMAKIDWSVVNKRDAERQARTRQLLAEGRLHTGADFLGAAYVFQHSGGDGFLLAHTLAIIATKKGEPGGLWIAAATLDRYLQQAGHKQIYGTQSTLTNGAWTKEPYDRDLISDALRRELGVPDLAAQAVKLAEINSQPIPSIPSLPPTATSQPTGGYNYSSVKCDGHPVTRVFAGTTWRISSCENGGLLAMSDSQPPAMVIVMVVGDKVVPTPLDGGDPAEVAAAVAAFSAMTPAQVAEIVAETKVVKP